jgi:hypothetical protein
MVMAGAPAAVKNKTPDFHPACNAAARAGRISAWIVMILDGSIQNDDSDTDPIVQSVISAENGA